MSSVIQNLLHQTLGDGARASKFECEISFGNLGLFSEDEKGIKYHVKTSQFPGKSNEVVELKFKGRNIPIRGQVKYDNTWSCTFYLSDDHSLKKAFEDWIESLDQIHYIPERLSRQVSRAKKNAGGMSYYDTMRIVQKDFHGENVSDDQKDPAVYTLYNVFPKAVSVVDTDYTSVGSILEFTVEFSYSHFTSTTNGIDDTNDVENIMDEIGDKLTDAATDIKRTAGEKVSEYASLINRKSGMSDIIRTAEDMLK